MDVQHVPGEEQGPGCASLGALFCHRSSSFSGLRPALFCAPGSGKHLSRVLVLVVGDLLAACGLRDGF